MPILPRTGSRWLSLALVGVMPLVGGACAADEGVQPEPELTTPGVFIGYEPEDGGVAIIRVLEALRFQGGLTLFVTLYAPVAEDFAEARELARDPNLPVSAWSVMMGDRDLTNYEILWYRSLAPEDRDAIP
ncbi:MAG: hypothetical protein JW751_23505 [Polyangiaceae bacterium]|nr:hypothetical protein [Polyangiaceae bacterium]